MDIFLWSILAGFTPLFLLVLAITLQTYLNNHLKLTIYYHSERMPGSGLNATAIDVCRIVAFDVFPQRFAVINFYST